MGQSVSYSAHNVVDEATRWIGYLEHLSNRQLGSYRINTGKGGCTAFAEIIRQKCGRNFQGVPWCAIFIHSCFVNVYGRELAKRLLGRPHAGTRVLARRMRRKGLWRGTDYIPVAGDIIFLANDGKRIDHCGIVVESDGETVTSIDGNTVDPSEFFREELGGAVALRDRALNDPRIIGYGATGGAI
jgi:hypothetical protein